jgi:hypothetical protein
MIINSDDYFKAYAGHPEITDRIIANAAELLTLVNDLLNCAIEEGVTLHKNPATGTFVSGQDNGTASSVLRKLVEVSSQYYDCQRKHSAVVEATK